MNVCKFMLWCVRLVNVMMSNEWLSQKNSEGKNVTHNYKTHKHICQHLRFLCSCNVDGVPSTHSKETQRTATHQCFLPAVYRRIHHNSLITDILVNFTCCCLSWSLTPTPSQCTLQMHTHCYKSHIPHIRAFSYLH